MGKYAQIVALTGFAAVLLASGLFARSEQVGEVGVDWLGNDIVVEAVSDPKVRGITCHVAYFERGLIDRLQQGNWFEDPSNASIDCGQTGPIVIGKISMGQDGEEVFKQRQSLIWKSVVVKRIYARESNSLIYLAHARQVQKGSAKMSISAVPLYGRNVEWSDQESR